MSNEPEDRTLRDSMYVVLGAIESGFAETATEVFDWVQSLLPPVWYFRRWEVFEAVNTLREQGLLGVSDKPRHSRALLLEATPTGRDALHEWLLAPPSSYLTTQEDPELVKLAAGADPRVVAQQMLPLWRAEQAALSQQLTRPVAIGAMLVATLYVRFGEARIDFLKSFDSTEAQQSLDSTPLPAELDDFDWLLLAAVEQRTTLTPPDAAAAIRDLLQGWEVGLAMGRIAPRLASLAVRGLLTTSPGRPKGTRFSMNRTGRAALQQWRQVPPTLMRRTRDIGAVRLLLGAHPVRLAQLMLPGVEELLATYGGDRGESVPPVARSMAAMGVQLLQIRRDFWSQLSEQAVTDRFDTSIEQLGAIPARIRERLPEAPGNDRVTVSVDWLPAATQVALPELD